MKLNKMILPLMLALAATVATSGCKKGPVKTTMIPGPKGGMVGDANRPETIPSVPPIDFGQPPTVIKEHGPIAYDEHKQWNPGDMIQDHVIFADQTVHFAFDSAAVLSKEENKLIIVSEKLKSDTSAKLLIEGHCDERGTEEYNRSLGERRALALREALIRSGIEAERVQTISYGKDKPADSGHGEAAWNKNRRGEFILCHPKVGA